MLTSTAFAGSYLRLEKLMNSIDIQTLSKDRKRETGNTSQELMANLLHNLPGMAYRCENDSKWSMLFLSEGCFSLTGYSPQELLKNRDLSYNDMIHPDDRALVSEAVRLGVLQNRQFQMEYRIICPSGEIKWVWERGIAVYDDRGNAVFLDGFITDISDLKKNQERLDSLASELLEANLKKDKFLDIIAHDLQNPIYAILSTADFLTQSQDQLNMEQVIDFCSQIHSSAYSISVLLENLVEWSRLQNGSIKLKPQSLKLGQLVSETLRYHHKHIRAKEINFELSVPEGLTLDIDLRTLESILRNLISNAVKYSEHGQSIAINAYIEGESVVLQVLDNGIGMSRQRLKNLFAIDNDLRSLGTALEIGSGLGLILVKKYVDRLSGEITIESKLNKGTKVTVRLPYKCADPTEIQRVKA